MTYRQFLLQVRATPRDWRLDGDRIRRRRGVKAQCPISSLARKSYWDAWEVGHALGLSPQLASDVVNVADGWCWDDRDRRMRRDLLRACGLRVGG